MKTLVSQLFYFLGEPEVRRNLRALFKYFVFVLAIICAYAALFHLIMAVVEGQEHSWLTGFYWTLTVMSTLGFGDITFHSDIGRLFSIVVLLSGIVLLLIMLPFAFIRYFYAPWLEAQIRLQAPREVSSEMKDHVIICHYDSIAPGLIRKLQFSEIPYFIIEPDPVAAARMKADDLSVVTGDLDHRMTYERLRVSHSRLVLANAEDTVNSNIALTVREVDADVAVTALAEHEESVDILELSGATHVLPLKQRLGEHLATRVKVGAGATQSVGRFKDLLIAEIANDTLLVGQTLRDARLRERTGVNVVGVWERGRLEPVRPDVRFTDHAVPVVVGTEEQLGRLNALLGRSETRSRLVLVIGGGKVGRAAATALARRGIAVSIVEKEEATAKKLAGDNCRLVVGDAADRDVLFEAGLDDATAVVLSTNDDAANIYLTVYCRRLKPDLNIVSRVTYERNVDAIYRAGADSVLSYALLGREHLIAQLFGREPIMVGEGAEFFLADVPATLIGKTISESRIGQRTGLIVIGVEDGEKTVTNPPPTMALAQGQKLLLLGLAEQRQAFATEFV